MRYTGMKTALCCLLHLRLQHLRSQARPTAPWKPSNSPFLQLLQTILAAFLQLFHFFRRCGIPKGREAENELFPREKLKTTKSKLKQR